MEVCKTFQIRGCHRHNNQDIKTMIASTSHCQMFAYIGYLCLNSYFEKTSINTFICAIFNDTIKV